MQKVIDYGKEVRAKVLDGVKKISRAVKVTLGPSGRLVLISEGVNADYQFFRAPIKTTKDGYTVTKYFDLIDPFEAVGMLAIKEAAKKTVDQAGDGTTTTVVLAEAIIEQGMKAIEDGANPVLVKKGIDDAVEYVVARLKEMAIPVGGDIEKIRQVATVSANNDSEIGNMIADAYKIIGDSGVIDIEESKTAKTEIKIAPGFKINKGMAAPFFINNTKEESELYEPYILLHDKPITLMKHIQAITQIVCVGQKKPLVIICPQIDGEALAFLGTNTMRKNIQTCVIDAPSFGQEREDIMNDIAASTGATYITEISGIDIENTQLHHLGQAKKVVSGKEQSVIIDGMGSEESKADLLNNLKMNLTQAETEEEKAKIETRIARIEGGVAVIHVGGATEAEMKERKDRVDDSVRATKAAIAEGIAIGGGAAYINIFKLRTADTIANILNSVGYNIVYRCLTAPFHQICDNAGVNGEELLSEMMPMGENIGYNAKTDKIEDLVKSGIVDPVKVLRCALINAASVAGQILLTECVISDSY